MRVLLVVLLIGAGLGASAIFLTRSLHSLRGSPLLGGSSSGLFAQTSTARRGASHSPKHPTAAKRPPVAVRARSRPTSTTTSATHHHQSRGPFGLGDVGILFIAGWELVGGLWLCALLAASLTWRRVRRRTRRDYALYELHLSMHDEAKPQDLEDMVEGVANIIRALPGERVRNGQPYLALELICNHGEQGMEWSINVRCEPCSVRALDAAISAAYPDVRIGRRHAEAPAPRRGALRVPGYVMRFRKQRSFVYPLVASGDEIASPPLEQVARTQVALDAPSIVRFQLTPTASCFEEYARRLYKRHENKLVRQERWGLPKGGLWSTLNRAEMSNAERTQNRSLFWLEAVVAADTIESCKTIAAAVQARRGENRLHRRWMMIRQGLYRRRFPQALGPLLPSTRNLVSAAEVAHLLELPTARMKGVPVRRNTLPRIPAPPEIARACRPRLTSESPTTTRGVANDGAPMVAGARR